MHRNRSWNHIVGIKGIWKMTSKITPVKLGDISEKKTTKTKTGRPKGRGKHSRLLRKKPINQNPISTKTTFWKIRVKTKILSDQEQLKKCISSQLPHRNYRSSSAWTLGDSRRQFILTLTKRNTCISNAIRIKGRSNTIFF